MGMSIYEDEDDEGEELDPKSKKSVTIELTVETLHTIDDKRGIVKRGPYIRQIILKGLPDAPTYPSEEE